MKTQEYLVTFRHYDTLEVIDMFYINAIDIDEAKQIANELTLECDYDNIPYFDISVTVQPA